MPLENKIRGLHVAHNSNPDSLIVKTLETESKINIRGEDHVKLLLQRETYQYKLKAMILVSIFETVYFFICGKSFFFLFCWVFIFFFYSNTI